MHGWLVVEAVGLLRQGDALSAARSTCSRAISGSSSATTRARIRAKVTGGMLTLDEALKEAVPAVLWLLDALPEDSPFLALEPAAAPPADPCCGQATAAAGEPSAAADAGVRGSALDRRAKPRRSSTVSSERADRRHAAGRQLPSRIPARLGEQDLLPPAAHRPLPPASAEELCDALIGDDPSIAPLKRLLIERTEGNPLFLEESVRTLVETARLVGERGAYRLRAGGDTFRCRPRCRRSSPRASIGSPPEQSGCCRRPRWSVSTCRSPCCEAIADDDGGSAAAGLAQLQAAEFVYETQLFPELEYTFKHALTHEVAYGVSSQERRRALHAAIVEAIERLYGTAWRSRSRSCAPRGARARGATRRCITCVRPGPRRRRVPPIARRSSFRGRAGKPGGAAEPR